jgi:Tfp pilus assembly protein PilO
MRNNRIWIIGATILSIAVLALGWFIGISPKLAEAADLSAQQEGVASNNAALRVKVEALKKQYATINDLRSQLDVLQAQVPSDLRIDDFFDELNEAAKATGVSIQSFTSTTPQHYALPSAPTDNKDSSSVVELPTTNPLITGDNLVMVPVNLSVKGSLSEIADFLTSVRQGQRLFLVNNTNITGTTSTTTTVTSGLTSTSTTSSSYTASVTGFIYILQDATAGPTTPVTPAPVPTPEPTPSETPSPEATDESTTTPEPTESSAP